MLGRLKMHYRDHYIISNVSTEVNAFMVDASRKLAVLGRVVGQDADAELL